MRRVRRNLRRSGPLFLGSGGIIVVRDRCPPAFAFGAAIALTDRCKWHDPAASLVIATGVGLCDYVPTGDRLDSRAREGRGRAAGWRPTAPADRGLFSRFFSSILPYGRYK